LLVGGISAFILILSLTILPVSIAVILSMIGSLLLTGAFHEDGLADTVDGFGGGWNKEKILQIMKDSAIGTYGAIALMIALLLKYQLLIALINLPVVNGISNHYFILLVLLSAHSLSRMITITTIITHQYARINDELSKIKSVTDEQLKWTSSSVILAIIIAVIPLFLFSIPLVFMILIPMYLSKFFLSKFFNKWINGYTGDCLGAIQQISEIVFYISIFLLWKFI